MAIGEAQEYEVVIVTGPGDRKHCIAHKLIWKIPQSLGGRRRTEGKARATPLTGIFLGRQVRSG